MRAWHLFAGLLLTLAPLAVEALAATPLCPPFTKYKIERLTAPSGFDRWKLTGEGCHMHHFTQSEYLQCMSDKWVVIFGGSNCVSTSAQWADLIMQPKYNPANGDVNSRNSKWGTNCPVSNAWVHWFDIVVLADGTVHSVKADRDCNQMIVSRGDFDSVNSANLGKLTQAVKDVGALPPGATRLTWVYCVKFPRVLEVVEALMAAAPQMTQPSVHLNIGVWYGSMSAFNQGLTYLLDEFKAKRPSMQIVIRDQSYSNDVMRAAFLTHYNKYLPFCPNIILLHEGSFSSPDTDFKEVWMTWQYSNHPMNPAGMWVVQSHIGAICAGFENQVPVAYQEYTSLKTSGTYSTCLYSSSNNYYEYVTRTCPATVANVAGTPAKPTCPSGMRNTNVWSNTELKWTGNCVVVPCPSGASGAPNCGCPAGYTSTLAWNTESGTYSGGCALASCPSNSIGAPNCKCNFGYQGKPAWSNNKWSADPCTLAPCPANGGTGPQCGCLEGFSGQLSFEAVSMTWSGACSLVTCPKDAANAPKCVCNSGFASTVAWVPAPTQKYSGDCKLVDCPKFAVGAPLCKCPQGYVDTLVWEKTTNSYAGNCTLQTCPAQAAVEYQLGTDVPECHCSTGWTGKLTWNDETDIWEGTCSPVTCPTDSTAAAGNAGCSCNLGYNGTVIWSRSRQQWEGTCRYTLCPANANNNPCTCVVGAFESVPLAFSNGKWSGTCTVASCPPNSANLPCQCSQGFVDTLKWTAPTYAGSCTLAPCPSNSTGHPACACNSGFAGFHTWDFQNNSWSGSCAAVKCPSKSRGRLAADGSFVCDCISGYTGELSWDASTQTWQGSCQLLPCPRFAEGAPVCQCSKGYQGNLSLVNSPAQAWAGACNRVKCPSNADTGLPGVCDCKEGFSGNITWNRFPLSSYSGSCTLEPCTNGLTSAPVCACPTGYSGYSEWNRTSQQWQGNCTLQPCPVNSNGAPTEINTPSVCQCNRMFTSNISWDTTALKWVPAECISANIPAFSSLPTNYSTLRDIPQCQLYHKGVISWSFDLGGNWLGKCTRVNCPEMSDDSLVFGCGCKSDAEGRLQWNSTAQEYSGRCTPARPLGLFVNDPLTSDVLCFSASGKDCKPKVNQSKVNQYVSTTNYDSYHTFLLLSSLAALAFFYNYGTIKAQYLKRFPHGTIKAQYLKRFPPRSKDDSCKDTLDDDDTLELTVNPVLDMSNVPENLADFVRQSHMISLMADQGITHIEGESVDAPYPPPPVLPTPEPVNAPKFKNTATFAVLEECDGKKPVKPLRKVLKPAKPEIPQRKPPKPPRTFVGSASAALRRSTVGQAIRARTSTISQALGFNDHEEKLWKDDGGDGFNIPPPPAEDDDEEEDIPPLPPPGSPPMKPTAQNRKSVLFNKTVSRPGARLSALGPARFVASVHIVAGHLVSKSPSMINPFPTTGWGFTWVPFFMMLSAFVLSYARAASSRPSQHQQPIPFLMRRLKSVYPLYITGLLAAAALRAYQYDETFSLGKTGWHAIAQLLLLQAWCPAMTENVFQVHCWFLSCIVPYWLLHRHIYLFMHKWQTRSLAWLLFGLTLVPWVFLVILPSLAGELNWYDAHKPTRFSEPVDIAVVMLKFSPFAYLPNYIYGVGLGLLFVRMGENANDGKRIPPFITYGASLSYGLLFFLFFTNKYTGLIPAYKMSARLGVLAPLHGLLLFGLSLGKDPLSRALGHKRLAFLGDISYPQYIFQFIAFNLWRQTAGFDGIGYWTVLLALAFSGSLLVDKKLNNLKATLTDKGVGVATVILLPVVLVLVATSVKETVPYQLPGQVLYPGGMYDAQLNLSGTGKFATGNIINPTLLPDPSDPEVIWVAARWHHYSQANEFGVFPTTGLDGFPVNASIKTTATWESHVLIGRLGAQTLSLLEPMKKLSVIPPFAGQNTSAEWTPCIPEYGGYQPGNNSVTQVISVGGLEDPRLMLTPQGKVALTFHSLPPVGMSYSAEAAEQTDSTNADPKPTQPGYCYTKGRVFRTVLPAWESLETTPSPTELLEWDRSQRSRPEKNWMAFFAKPSTAKTDLFVTSVVPHRVIQPIKTENGTIMHSDNSSDTMSRLLVSKADGIVFHGGANGLYVDRENNATVDPYFLGTFHSINGNQYRSYMYKFQTTPPFAIRKISGLLPLLPAPLTDKSISRPLAFNSGLAILPSGSVLVSYGSSNSHSRVLVIPPAKFAEFFLKDD